MTEEPARYLGLRSLDWLELLALFLLLLIGLYGWWRARQVSPTTADSRRWILEKAHRRWMRGLAWRWPSRWLWGSAFVAAVAILGSDFLEAWYRQSGTVLVQEGETWLRTQWKALPPLAWLLGIVAVGLLALGVGSLLRKREIIESAGGELGAAQFLDPLQTTEWGARPKGSGLDPAAPNPVLAYLLVVAPRSKKARLGLVAAKREHWTLLPLRAQQLNQGILLIGMPGTGKTTRVFHPLLLTARVPVIYNDTKARLPLKGQRRRARVWGLDVRGIRSRSEVWNPLEEFHSEEDLDLLGAVLLPDRRGDKDPWVRSGARELLEELLKLREAKGWESLSDLADWLLARSPEAWAKELGPTYVYSAQDPRKFGAIADDLKTALKVWAKPRIRRISHGPSTVRLEDFIRHGGYVLGADQEENRGPIKVFWALLLDQLKRRAEGSGQIILALDEFGDAGAVPDMPTTLATVRDRGVSVIAGIQSFSLLKRTYQADSDAVRDGFGHRFFYLENFPDEDRQNLSKWVGSRTLQQKPKTGKPPAQPFAAPLLPVDAIGAWGDAGALLARGNHWTWWHPVRIDLEDYPREPMPAEEDGEEDFEDSTPHAPSKALLDQARGEAPNSGDRFGF